MKIESEGNYIELEIQLETESSLPSYGDALIGIVISSNGYQGKNQVWVAKQQLESFYESLLRLERDRSGEAVLTSMSPGELSLRIYSYDRRGNMAIDGETGHYILGDAGFNHAVKFGFTIEPEQLVKISKAKWVSH